VAPTDATEERDRFTNGKVRNYKTAAPNVFVASLGCACSQRLRKHNEESFDWNKTVGGLAQLKVRGLAKCGPSSYSLSPHTILFVCPSFRIRPANCTLSG
jgi:hypothetical protein